MEEGICCTGWLVCIYIVALFSKKLGKAFPNGSLPWTTEFSFLFLKLGAEEGTWGLGDVPGRCCQAVPTHCALLCSGCCQPRKSWTGRQGNAWGRLSALLSTAAPCEAELSPEAQRKDLWGCHGEGGQGADFSHAVLCCSGVCPQSVCLSSCFTS